MDVLTPPKQPAEKRSVYVDYTGRLPEGVSLTAVTASAIDLTDNSDVTSALLTNASGTIDDATAIFQLKAGVDGRDYQVTFRADLSNGDKFEEDLLVEVREET